MDKIQREYEEAVQELVNKLEYEIDIDDDGPYWVYSFPSNDLWNSLEEVKFYIQAKEKEER